MSLSRIFSVYTCDRHYFLFQTKEYVSKFGGINLTRKSSMEVCNFITWRLFNFDIKTLQKSSLRWQRPSINLLYNMARVLALYKSYWAAMNKIFIYTRPCVNKMTWAFFLPGFRVSFLESCSAVFLFFEIWKKPVYSCTLLTCWLTHWVV